jgi:hypothetical protein
MAVIDFSGLYEAHAPAVAAVFTLLPLNFVFEGSRVTFLLICDAPIIGVAWWATALVMRLWHAMVRRRLRVSGL